jgi:hypothetical protein
MATNTVERILTKEYSILDSNSVFSATFGRPVFIVVTDDILFTPDSTSPSRRFGIADELQIVDTSLIVWCKTDMEYNGENKAILFRKGL